VLTDSFDDASSVRRKVNIVQTDRWDSCPFITFCTAGYDVMNITNAVTLRMVRGTSRSLSGMVCTM